MRAVAAVALIGLWSLGVSAAAMDQVTLPLPRPLQPGDHLSVAVTVGPIGRQRIEVTTARGQPIGTIAPFGVAAGRSGGTYLLPVPPDAVHDGQVELRFSLLGGAERRGPTTDEVTSAHLVLPGE
jgi:hypothetical protein